MTNKITKKIALNYVIENCTIPAEIKTKLESMLSVLENKPKNRKPTAKQKENEVIKQNLLKALTDKPQTITELQKNNDDLFDYTNQKLSSLLRQLIADDKVEREVRKGRTYFKLM